MFRKTNFSATKEWDDKLENCVLIDYFSAEDDISASMNSADLLKDNNNSIITIAFGNANVHTLGQVS